MPGVAPGVAPASLSGMSTSDEWSAPGRPVPPPPSGYEAVPTHDAAGPQPGGYLAQTYPAQGYPPAPEDADEHFDDARAFSYWHVGLGGWALEGGAFEIRVAASSRDVRLADVIALTGDLVEPVSPELPTAAWLDHPVAGPLVRARLAGDPVYDEHRMNRVRENPFNRVARMHAFPIAEAELPALAAEVNAAVAVPD